jgi:Na+/H+ antiporter NhaD/arsenite permease-like protein
VIRTAAWLLILVGLIAVFSAAGQALASDGLDTVHSAQTDHPENEPIDHGGDHGEVDLGKVLPIGSTIPFAGMLLSIALFPLIAGHFWHHHYPKIAAFWALMFMVPFVWFFSDNPTLAVFSVILPIPPFILALQLHNKTGRLGAWFGFATATAMCLVILHQVGGAAWHEIVHIYIIDYLPFIILLWSLYTISGGVFLTGTLRGSPRLNLLLLLIGTLLASWVGTTGAAMIMIRPILRANDWRRNRIHIVVFFIFLVANVGGSLTPLGDPPLFLGFLHGVSFFWTMRLLPQTILLSGILLALFYVVDSWHYRREAKPDRKPGHEPIRVRGLINLIFLGGVIGAVLMSGMLDLGEVTILGVHQSIQNLLRDVLLILMGLLSISATPPDLRQANKFTWEPIREVAYLFAGIFMTIIPALAILRAGSEGALAFLVNAVNSPRQYFWATGVLSSFLDNAPTYLTFFSSAQAKLYPGIAEPQAVQYMMGHVTEGVASGAAYLAAISAGAVFMGAVTYIGNAPNFMVKSIAEEAGVPMPSFFGYLLRYSLPFLGVSLVIVTLVFY